MYMNKHSWDSHRADRGWWILAVRCPKVETEASVRNSVSQRCVLVSWSPGFQMFPSASSSLFWHGPLKRLSFSWKGRAGLGDFCSVLGADLSEPSGHSQFIFKSCFLFIFLHNNQKRGKKENNYSILPLEIIFIAFPSSLFPIFQNRL